MHQPNPHNDNSMYCLRDHPIYLHTIGNCRQYVRDGRCLVPTQMMGYVCTVEAHGDVPTVCCPLLHVVQNSAVEEQHLIIDRRYDHFFTGVPHAALAHTSNGLKHALHSLDGHFR